MKKIHTLLNAGFLFLLAAFLLGGLAVAVLRPKEINFYENRPANRLHRPTLGTFLDTTFQDSVEDGLSDQILMAQTFKKAYNDGSSQLLLDRISGFLESHPQRYIYVRGMYFFGGDHLVYGPWALEDADHAGRMAQKAEGLNRLMDAHPDLDFYAYYVEKDTDINFMTGVKAEGYEYLRDRLDVPEGHMARFQIDSFDEFRQYFFRTDHHWNCYGSYKGYQEVAKLLGVDEPLLEPQEELLLPYTFSGSKTASAGIKDVYWEDFPVYRFDYPEMEITAKSGPLADYGQLEECLAGQLEKADYGICYGGDLDAVVFDTGRKDREDILIIGDSYDNAILKLVASHFHKTHSIDLRYNDDFSFSQYVRENPVDKVLFIGNMDYYVMEEFLPED